MMLITQLTASCLVAIIIALLVLFPYDMIGNLYFL